jgi:hypothetical protein
MMRAVLLAGAACIVAHAASAAILTVGPGKTYATVSAAIAASANGDVIQVQSGTYTNDTATITTSITIESVGGRSSMVATVPVPNTKGILVIGTATTSPIVTIDGFDFSGATTPSGTNAAGVMYQSGFLTLTNDSFHNNQDGLRGAPISVGSVLVDHCEFFSNGINDSLTHNVYIGIMPSFTIQNSYIHDAIGGHNIKSRALNTTVRNNRIFDNSNQTSYSVDIPQSGNATIDSNIIQQSAVNANPAMIAYGEESGVTQNPGTTFAVSNNTFVNDMTGSPIGANTQSGDIALGIRPTLDTTTLPYNTVYTAPLTLSVIAGRLAVISGKFALLAPGSRGGGGVPAGALVDETGAAIVDETGAAIIAN